MLNLGVYFLLFIVIFIETLSSTWMVVLYCLDISELTSMITPILVVFGNYRHDVGIGKPKLLMKVYEKNLEVSFNV